MDRTQTGHHRTLESLLTHVERRSDALQQARASAAAYGAAHGFQNTDVIDGALQALAHVAADIEARLAEQRGRMETPDQ
jgi:hypothetical protein